MQNVTLAQRSAARRTNLSGVALGGILAGLVVMMAGLWVFFDPGAVSPYCASEGDGCAYYQGGYSRGWAAGAQSMGAALTALGSALLGANWWLGKRDAAMP